MLIFVEEQFIPPTVEDHGDGKKVVRYAYRTFKKSHETEDLTQNESGLFKNFENFRNCDRKNSVFTDDLFFS